MSINLKFLKYRPVGVRVKEDPRQWWRYAISAVTKEEVRRKMEMWSWKHIQQHRYTRDPHVTVMWQRDTCAHYFRKWCRQYTNSYARKLVAKTITSGLQKELDVSIETRVDEMGNEDSVDLISVSGDEIGRFQSHRLPAACWGQGTYKL